MPENIKAQLKVPFALNIWSQAYDRVEGEW